MDLLTDLEFLRTDNTHLLKEVQSLRQQSELLRQRSEELERRLQEHNAGTSKPGTPEDKNIKRISFRDSKFSKTDTNNERAPTVLLEANEPQVIIRSTEFQSPHISIAWDDSPIERVAPAHVHRHFSNFHSSSYTGPHLIGEAPANASVNKSLHEKNQSHDLPITNSFPPSPDPSEPQQKTIRVPSLLSVVPPVSGVALPNVAMALLELRLIKKEAFDSPAAISSFMQKLTHAPHIPRSTYRAAFIDAFMYIIPLLGPIGSLSTEWLAFLHDFPSRIPASHRDSFVSIVWPQQIVPVPGSRPPHSTTASGKKGVAVSDSMGNGKLFVRPRSRSRDSKRRSRSMDTPFRFPQQPPVLPPILTNCADIARFRAGLSGPSGPSTPAAEYKLAPNNKDNPNSPANDRKDQQPVADNVKQEPLRKKDDSTTHSPPCERDAWVLLLALAYAAFPDSKVAKRMCRLPVAIRLQMIAWMPPGVSVYANMQFASTTVDEALGQLWDCKKEILRLRNGWE